VTSASGLDSGVRTRPPLVMLSWMKVFRGRLLFLASCCADALWGISRVRAANLRWRLGSALLGIGEMTAAMARRKLGGAKQCNGSATRGVCASHQSVAATSGRG